MHGKSQRIRAFTLIELLAVMLVILALAAILIGVAGYVQKQMGIQTTRSQIVAIGAALEMYKADWGFYPATNPGRISANGLQESSNNCVLLYALSAMNSLSSSNCGPTNCYTLIVRQGRKVYLHFTPLQYKANPATGLTNICDAWGTPLNYYNSPTTPFSLVNSAVGSYTTNQGYSVGGQVNLTTYDLFSYGPDHLTYVPTIWEGSWWALNPWSLPDWANPSSANDDLTNWGR